MRRLLLSTVAVLALSGTAHAQATPPDSGAPAPDVAGHAAANAVSEVVVVANRTPAPIDTVGQSVTVLTLPQIRADQEVLISDILQRTPGVQVSRNGGAGQATALRIRGAETDQTVVLIDGVKLNDPASTGGGYNFADLAVSDAARIEVLRGPQSVLYGSQAIGGVVNIVTADPTRPLEGDAQAEGGSYATAYGKAAVGGRDGRLTWRGAVSSYVTDGVSAFNERRGGREDDGYHNTALTGRVGYALTDHVSVDGRVFYVDARNSFDGFPAPNFALADTAEFGRTQEVIGYAGLNADLFDGRLRNRIAAQVTDTERQNLNPAQAVTARTFDASGVNRRFEYQGTFAVAPGWTAVFGAERERSSFSTASPSSFNANPPANKSAVSINSGYGQVHGEVVPGLSLTGGVRYDDHSTFGGHATGQAAVAWAPEGGATVLRASFGQGFKAPTLYQLYSPYGSLDLKPETADGWDASVEQRFWSGRAVVQATYFGRRTDDLIGFFSCPFGGTPAGRCVAQPFGYYANIARSEAEGAEFSGALRPWEGAELTANYTYTDARDRSPGSSTQGRFLPRRPEHLANLAASYRFGFGLTAGLAARYAGSSFDNAANTARLKSYALLDLRASYPVWRRVELYGRVENLFDRRYETAAGYGSLGRAAYAGVRASF